MHLHHRRRHLLAVTAALLVVAATLLPGSAQAAAPGAVSSVTWATEPWLALGPPVADVSVRDVACPTTTLCQAVGTYTAMDGRRHALVETWNGSSWRLARLPRLPGDRNRLLHVSCATDAWCVSLGTPIGTTSTRLALRWDGTSWQRMSTAGLKDVDVLDLSCPGVTSCMAIGKRSTWQWDGRTWTSRPPVTWDQDVRDVLAGVSCTSRDDCTLVGHRQRRGATPTDAPLVEPLVEHWDGTRWKVVRTGVADAGGRLTSVSCVARGVCTAVGSLDDGTQVLTQAPGLGWTASSLPLPHPSVARMAADRVSCVVGGACTALGRATDSGTGSTPFIATRTTGGTWSTADTVADRDHAVSCASDVHCIVTATSAPSVPSGPTQGRAWRSSGLTLSARTFVNPPGNPGGELQTVSCLPSGFCAAGGESATGHAFAVRQAATWSTTPGDDQDSSVADLSCVTTTFCLAVGRGPTRQPVSYAWDGSRWNDVPVTTAPAGDRVGLTRISCVTTAWCLALGSAEGSPFLMRWNGTTWKQSTALSLPDHSSLGSVSCSATSWCVVVGSSGVGPARQQPLIAMFDGNRWVRTSGATTRQPSTSLSSVSCTSERFCMAVGQTGRRAGSGTQPGMVAAAFAERWDGQRWRVARGAGTLATRDTMSVLLHSVSCSGPRACLDTNRTWAGAWDGRRWMPSRPPVSLSRDAQLRDVSCLANLFCLGVGLVTRNAYNRPTSIPLIVTSSP